MFSGLWPIESTTGTFFISADAIEAFTGCLFISFGTLSKSTGFIIFLRFACSAAQSLRERYRSPLAFICSNLCSPAAPIEAFTGCLFMLCLLCCAISSRTLSKSTGLSLFSAQLRFACCPSERYRKPLAFFIFKIARNEFIEPT